MVEVPVVDLDDGQAMSLPEGEACASEKQEDLGEVEEGEIIKERPRGYPMSFSGLKEVPGLFKKRSMFSCLRLTQTMAKEVVEVIPGVRR